MHIEVHRAGISTLPVEILAEIFWHCVPDAATFQDPVLRTHQAHPLNAPILLTRVSRYWREIALNTPSLWSSLSLADGACGGIRVVDAYLSALKTWLSLSQSLPLRIKLDAENHYSIMITYLSLLCDEADRWNEVYLESCHPTHFQTSHKSSFPILTSLSLKLTSTDYGHTQFPVFFDALSSAPNLRRVDITFHSMAGLPLPWSALTEYAFRCTHHYLPILDLPQFVVEMRKCHSLAKALFEITEGVSSCWIKVALDGDMNDNLRRATLPRLLHLTISTDDTNVFDALFDSLSAPSLEHITIQSTDQYGSPWGQSNNLALKGFLASCADSLTSIQVEIPANMIPAGLLIEVLRDLPSLLTMYFIGPDDYLYWSHVLDALVIRGHLGTNLRLRSFGVHINSWFRHREPRRHRRNAYDHVVHSYRGNKHDPDDQKLFFDSLKAMVESRLPPIHALDEQSGSASYTSLAGHLETLRVSSKIFSDAEGLASEPSSNMLQLWSAGGLRLEITPSRE